MTFHKAPLPLMCVAASLLVQACVQYNPSPPYPPPPPPPPPYSAAPPGQPAASPAPQSADFCGIDALMAPIALYPDPLLAILLPASTVPSDITAASAYLIQYGDVSRIDSQPWDPSVRALAHYPKVIAWMAENIAWTQALGAEFASSPAEVMDSVQRLRARAWAAGTLASTPQQQVFSDEDAIEILPAQTDMVYAPAYDPDVMFSDEPYYGYGGPFIFFGEPYPAGIWLNYAFDWHRHRVWAGDRDAWHEHDAWQSPHFDGDREPPGAHSWHHRHSSPGDLAPDRGVHGNGVPAPRPMQGVPNPPPSHYRISVPQPGRPAPVAGFAQPRERPRLGLPFAPAASGASARPAEGAPRPRQPETGGVNSQGPIGAVHNYSPAPEPRQPAAPPAPAAHEPSAQAPAPARTQAPPPAAHAVAHESAPAPAHESAPAAASSHQPQK